MLLPPPLPPEMPTTAAALDICEYHPSDTTASPSTICSQEMSSPAQTTATSSKTNSWASSRSDMEEALVAREEALFDCPRHDISTDNYYGPWHDISTDNYYGPWHDISTDNYYGPWHDIATD
eukprot:GHVS01007791.1.p2 GENE.GHVS01007791.1~~GHVS01007791.1.p2  ORF type:complete len:122 (-),score=33.27 GHVS01007791.1:119-484(-)